MFFLSGPAVVLHTGGHPHVACVQREHVGLEHVAAGIKELERTGLG